MIVDRKTARHEVWIQPSTLQKIRIRKDKKAAPNDSRTRAAEAAAQEEYSEAHREVERCLRENKRGRIDNLARQAEEAAVQRNIKDLYDITWKLAGRYQQTGKPVNDKQGTPLTTVQDELTRWTERFSKLLNRPAPEDPLDIAPAETINIEKPSRKETRKAIEKLKM